MLSVSGNNWEELILNNRIIEKVKVEKNFSDIISKLIISRNFDSLEIKSINEKVNILNPFLKNKDFVKTHQIINECVKNKERILVIGDYDVDGCISTALLINFFKKINIEINYYIPDRRKDGYGVNINLIKELIKKKPALIIMVDCGSVANKEIDFLNDQKIKTIIIDHHEIYKPYPKSSSLINPKKECDYNSYDYFCSATLTYFLIDSYIHVKKLDINFKENLIYILLATVSDVMPLRKINRYIAINVLKKFDIQNNFLIKRIFELKKIKKKLEINDLGFLLGPILNSAGRLSNASDVVELLITKNDLLKEKIIKNLISINEKRKNIQEISFKDINFEKIKNNKNNVLVLNENFLHEGIIGIIASQLKDYFNKPCVIITNSNNKYKASARSLPTFNIGIYIKNAVDKNILINGGGHNLAAGFTIKKENINKFNEYINLMFDNKTHNYNKYYISKISTNAINTKFYDILKKVGPFGMGNSDPIFLLEKVKIIKPKILMNKYITFYIKSKNGKLIAGIFFNTFESEIFNNLLNNKNELNLIVQIKENLWNNKKNLQLIVLDIINLSNKA